MSFRRLNILLLQTWALATIAGSVSSVTSADDSGSGYEFAEGFPTVAGGESAIDDADLQRAITAYRFWYPTVSCEAIFNGGRELGIADNEAIMVLSAGPRHVGFTLNSDTPYGGGTLDLTDGPYVVELPPGPYIGLIDDHHQGWVLDMGLPGPDAGQGGKHLILPPDFEGEVPEGYHVGRSNSYKVLIALRALPQGGDAAAAIESLRRVKIYPLASSADPQLTAFVDLTETPIDNTPLRWERNIGFWETLHAVIDAEPIVEEFLPMYGLLAAIGIEKGKPFEPNLRMTGILEQAARIGRDQMLVSAFASQRPDRHAWDDRRWEWAGFVSDNGGFATPSGIDLESRDRWFIQAIVASPAMFRRTQGAGSLYWLGHRDSNGDYLDGGKSYSLTIPHPVPANLFWSVTAYDAATRSQVQAEQDKAVIGSLHDNLAPNADGTVTLHFGPEPPADGADQWIQTVPGRGWFTYFRIYGPQPSAFDGAWKLGDFELVQ